MFISNNSFNTTTIPNGTFNGSTGISQRLIQEGKKFWQAFTVPILMSLGREFCLAAAKYSPPGRHGKQLGTTSIQPSYYYCKIVDLNKYVNDPSLSSKIIGPDWQHIKRKQMFKVIYTKYRQKRKVLGYRKTLAGAKKLARIKNRGLMKYSWGTLLSDFGTKYSNVSKTYEAFDTSTELTRFETNVPPTFRLLAQKSPNITKYNWGAMKIQAQDILKAKWKLEGHNKKTDTNAFNGIAVREGTYAAVKRWKSIIAAFRNKNPNTFQRYFNFNIQKINKQLNKK